MNDRRYKWILNIIVVVILCTIAIQVYWNYKNYLTNKQQLINDVQVSLDNAVDAYYANLAEKSTYQFSFKTTNNIDREGESLMKGDTLYDRLFGDIEIFNQSTGFDSINKNNIEHISIIKASRKDTIILIDDNMHSNIEWIQNQVFIKESTTASEMGKRLEKLTANILMRLSYDTLELSTIDSLLLEEFERKNISLTYGLSFKNQVDSTQNSSINMITGSALQTRSKSSFLPKFSTLNIHFENATKVILKRILLSIFISTLLVLAVIGCLFYLLKIIKHQKQLAEVKNDLISNITHEFKTPIATISVALESIKNFNTIDDKEKTKTYLNMSIKQLQKLNTMVEKLLETATLDSGNLELNKVSINVSELLESLVLNYQMQTDKKTITLNTSNKTISAKVDIFHFESAINNIIDNAIKYGGDAITIDLLQTNIAFTITITDNGNSLSKTHKELIFDEFYRVPQGNTHDVKGFGIGLYYSKKIIEKHGGVINLDLANNETSFKLSIPNE